MKTTCVMFLTFVWLAGWMGITLGLAGCLTPAVPSPTTLAAFAAIDR